MEKGVGLLLGGILSAQVWVSATVVDSAGEPLPFVSVYNLRAHQGTYTDLQGRFRIEALPTDTIEIRCVGYQTLRVPASSFSAVVRLVEQPIEVMPVVIRPGENPAHELIRRLQAQRGRWDPLGRPHKYLSYNKLTLGLPDSVRSDTLPPHLFLWETETEKVYHSPSRQIETLRAQRVVGNLPVQSILSPTSFLPISLYTDRLRLLENHLISPIGDEALNYYEYAIRDTIFSGKDTLIRIDFFPQRGREAWTLKGQLTIVLPDAALYAFQGEAYIPSFQSSLLQTSFYRIWHYYERLGDTLWFPTQLHSEVKLKVRTAQAGVGLILRSRSFLRSVELLRESERPLYPEVVLPEQVPSVEQRAEPLTPEESRSYQVLDSLLRKVELRRWQWLLDLPTLVSGRISLGRVNLIWRPFLLYHEAEGLRPQMGLETNDNLSERFRVRVWVGYGSYRWAGAQGTPWRYGVEGEMGQLWRGRLFYYDDVRELTLPRLLDEQPAFLPGEQRLYEVPVRGYAFRWESMVRERAGGMYLRLPLGGRALGYFSGIVAERSLFGERQQGIVTTFGMEYLHNQVLLRRGGLLWRAEYELPRIHLQGGVLWQGGRGALPFWLQVDFLHRWQWGRWALMRVRLSGAYTHSLPSLWQLQLRTLPEGYLGGSDMLAAHPIRRFVSGVVYAFYEWSIPNTRFPSRQWAPMLSMHFQGAYADGVIYPESGVSLQNWLPPMLYRIFPSLGLTRVGVFTSLAGRLSMERFYFRLSSQLF